jgi:hypothetical protein
MLVFQQLFIFSPKKISCSVCPLQALTDKSNNVWAICGQASVKFNKRTSLFGHFVGDEEHELSQHYQQWVNIMFFGRTLKFKVLQSRAHIPPLH